MYKSLIRPLLFKADPEKVHHSTFSLLKKLSPLPGVKGIWRSMFCYEHQSLERELFGIRFKNPVGLAAGFDKDAKIIDELACLGFGHIEIGTVTPKGQPGNDKPRLFRLPQDKAIINRMGFNNDGAIAAVERLKKRKSDVIVGGNIGKNKVTPNEKAFEDYEYCFETLYPVVDYFTLNVSSPNTPNLRELQDKEPLTKLLKAVINLNLTKEKPKPILLKIAPDLTEGQLEDIVDIVKEVQLDGLIAHNTTISREGLKTSQKLVEEIGAGGLSGKPLTQRSTQILRFLRGKLGQEFPIISVGGIMSAQDALEKIDAGASLIQVYTGFIYEGPALIKQINKVLVSRVKG
ncbi:quinone-dependent dihydroorotate dehydrogenase [Fulvivirga sediminis]|uniref:Dihydroorotate dehydrogenase (quinone) n=1 Tax=Fulvivirga sediminis TaxID=2803949 RepID=A0A937JZI5_9BACT|nr:quinone-dependent dihydroorotate dehydrogenase [Fulvivirga sediminis]MBL3656694.1 quinone-dependent dihydroorotate dehydrogenase [Fulvivirga sediminis]